MHLPAPLAIAKDSNYDIKRIEGGLEGDDFVEIEDAGNYIYNNPDKPLFEILPRQGPDANKAEGRGEAVGDGHTRIGAGDEEEVEGCPNDQGGNRPQGCKAQGEMGYGQRLGL